VGRELFELLFAALPDLQSLEQVVPLLLMAAQVPAWRPPLVWFLSEAMRAFRLGRRAFLVFDAAGVLAQHARVLLFIGDDGDRDDGSGGGGADDDGSGGGANDDGGSSHGGGGGDTGPPSPSKRDAVAAATLSCAVVRSAVRCMGARLLREVGEALADMPELGATLTACRESVAASLREQ
jgi:hypothetical protein